MRINFPGLRCAPSGLRGVKSELSGPDSLLPPGQMHGAGAAGRMRGDVVGGYDLRHRRCLRRGLLLRGNIVQHRRQPAFGLGRRSCPCARHNPRPGRARSCRRRNRSFRDGRNKAPTPTSPATSQSSRSGQRRRCSPHRAGGTASPSRCDRAARDSQAPGGCRHIARGSADRRPAPRPARSPRIPCGRADASARQTLPPDDRPAPCTGSRSNRHWRS